MGETATMVVLEQRTGFRDGTRFNGILRPIDGVCGSHTDGVRCSRGGYRGHEGRIRCAPCRADSQTADTVECDVCGCAATDGILDWVSLRRVDMVCRLCLEATLARAPNQWCDCCGSNRATQATADGSAACRGCGDNFSQLEGWLARAQRLCKRAARRLGAPASRFTEESARGLWLWAAEQWASDSNTDYCGNAITWNCICSTIPRLNTTSVFRHQPPTCIFVVERRYPAPILSSHPFVVRCSRSCHSALQQLPLTLQTLGTAICYKLADHSMGHVCTGHRSKFLIAY